MSVIENKEKVLLGIYDPKLSWKATGMLAYLLKNASKKNMKIKELTRCKTDGLTSCKNALKELETNNYFHCFALKQGNKLLETLYFVSEIAIPYTEELKEKVWKSIENLDDSYTLTYKNI